MERLRPGYPPPRDTSIYSYRVEQGPLDYEKRGFDTKVSLYIS